MDVWWWHIINETPPHDSNTADRRRRLYHPSRLSVSSTAAQIGIPPAPSTDRGPRPPRGEYKAEFTIGCKDCRNESGWCGHGELGHNLTIMLENALRETGQFVLVEREKLADVLTEQDLAVRRWETLPRIASTRRPHS